MVIDLEMTSFNGPSAKKIRRMEGDLAAWDGREDEKMLKRTRLIGRH